MCKSHLLVAQPEQLLQGREVFCRCKSLIWHQFLCDEQLGIQLLSQRICMHAPSMRLLSTMCLVSGFCG